MSNRLDPRAVEELADALVKGGLIPSTAAVNRMFTDAGNGSRSNVNGDGFSITRAIRGQLARMGHTLEKSTERADIEYAEKTIGATNKVLTTGTAPGSSLVPTVQGPLLEMLGSYGVLRRSGATVWPMPGTQKLDLPTEMGRPTVAYAAQTDATDPSDPDFGQVNLNLKERRSLVAIPNALLRSSSPAIDAIVSRLLGKAFGKHEDNAFFGASSLSGGPTCLLDAAGVTEVHQNGAVLAYEDFLEVLAAEAEAADGTEGNHAWFMRPRIFFERVLNMRDEEGRLIVQPHAASENGPQFRLFGSPIHLTNSIPKTLGTSPALESYICYTNPAYFHIGDSGAVEIQVSDEFYFNKNQTAIRGIHNHDFGVAPASAVVTLMGVV